MRWLGLVASAAGFFLWTGSPDGFHPATIGWFGLILSGFCLFAWGGSRVAVAELAPLADALGLSVAGGSAFFVSANGRLKGRYKGRDVEVFVTPAGALGGSCIVRVPLRRPAALRLDVRDVTIDYRRWGGVRRALGVGLPLLEDLSNDNEVVCGAPEAEARRALSGSRARSALQHPGGRLWLRVDGTTCVVALDFSGAADQNRIRELLELALEIAG